jgi:two-component system sensor histidine kinase YesM
MGIMLRRLHSLIEERISSEKILHRTELKLLQMQIAPHFIYNSFNILRHAIHIGELEIAENLSGRLCDYFRYVTYNEQDMLPLSEEYRFAEDYLEIQKIRFQERITISISPLPERFKNMLVPRMILQPLIDNSFKHGIWDMENSGEIFMYTKVEDNILKIFVRDNGSGVNEEKLEEIRDLFEGKNPVGGHSGLLNIVCRLRELVPGSTFEVYGTDKHGFVSVISIPLNKEGTNV